MTREIKFSYIWQHEEMGMFGDRHLTLDDITDESFQDYLHDMMRTHRLLARRQWTGLSDKNGKEIYELDVVKTRGHHRAMAGFNVVNGSWELWSNPDREDTGSVWSLTLDTACCCEVVGNVHEYPELLKETTS